MKQETLKHLGNGTTAVSVSTGASSYLEWFTFLNDYAPAIGIILSFIFGLIGIVFYVLNYKKQTVADENKIRITELQQEISLISDRKTKRPKRR